MGYSPEIAGLPDEKIIPVACLTGVIGETVEKKSTMPAPKELWKSLSHSILFIASANHDLKICPRDLFKADLDIKYVKNIFQRIYHNCKRFRVGESGTMYFF